MDIKTRIKILQKEIDSIPEKGHFALKNALEQIVEVLKELADRKCVKCR